jgi:hypothetical protein
MAKLTADAVVDRAIETTIDELTRDAAHAYGQVLAARQAQLEAVAEVGERWRTIHAGLRELMIHEFNVVKEKMAEATAVNRAAGGAVDMGVEEIQRAGMALRDCATEADRLARRWGQALQRM